MTRTFVVAAGIAVLCGAIAAPVTAQESKSAPLAKQLAQALDAAKAESIAAADPTTGGFVAALYIPGNQLLVVSGAFDTPDLGTHRISKKEYRDLYMDLHGAAKAGTRLFAMDVSCNGLSMKAADAADSWEQANKTISFEGHRKAKMSEEEYAKAFMQADEQYARILALLLAQAKPKTGS